MLATWPKPRGSSARLNLSMRELTENRDEQAAHQWSEWASSQAYTLGVEEEVMLLDPEADWALAHRIDDVLPELSGALASRVAAETHGSALELSTEPHETVASSAAQIHELRRSLASELEPLGLRTASAGTHPSAVWNDMRIAGGDRHQAVYGSMRELARREPTFALHVHIGVRDPEAAILLHNRLRLHLALLLALSANSPFWQGRDTGLASARIPIFQAFPRVGVPRSFSGYDDYVETVDLLLRCEAFPEPTYLWWDIRPQPKFGTIEVRIMDAQIKSSSTRALVALLQSIAHLELEEGFLGPGLQASPELLAENRFIASRDGMAARLIDPVREERIPAPQLVAELLEAARPHADELGCRDELESVAELVAENGAAAQLRLFNERGSLPAVVGVLADEFCAD
jgi:carboxylate-amine ligase